MTPISNLCAIKSLHSQLENSTKYHLRYFRANQILILFRICYILDLIYFNLILILCHVGGDNFGFEPFKCQSLDRIPTFKISCLSKNIWLA